MSSFHRKRSVSVNDRGHTVGEEHHRARLTDHDIELVRALRAEGMGIVAIAAKFEVAFSTVAKYCRGTLRGQLGTGQKLVGPTPLRFKARRPARPGEFDDCP